MRIDCAWCKRVMSEDHESDSQVSHGICPACLEKALATLNANVGFCPPSAYPQPPLPPPTVGAILTELQELQGKPPAPTAKTAEERAQELMHAPGSEVPFKARQFYQHLHHLKGRPAATLSVYEHAYTLYAVVVEHLTPRVPLEQSTIDYARHWFGTN